MSELFRHRSVIETVSDEELSRATERVLNEAEPFLARVWRSAIAERGLRNAAMRQALLRARIARALTTWTPGPRA